MAFGKQKNKNGTFRRRTQCNKCRGEDRIRRTAAETKEQKLNRRDKFLQRTYGITLNDYDLVFNGQSGRCKGCNKHQSELPKALVVDHNHVTKTVRGLLCGGCNLALGNVKENTTVLTNLAKYLGAYQCA